MKVLTGNPKHERQAVARGTRRRAFLLLLVTVVIAIASLAALNFSRSMLISHEVARISNARLQARMAAESAAQSIRLFLAYPRTERLNMGGTWENPAMFQAVNIVPDVDPARRTNVTVLAPSMDEMGNFMGFRYGLQNESAKLNLNTLAQLDALAASGDAAAASVGLGANSLGAAAGSGNGLTEQLNTLAATATDTSATSLASALLMTLPGMTEDVADAILDFIDEDDEPRPLGAEFPDYYSQLQPPYKPANGPLQSIEQLLLVRGVTPAKLFGYDENRNGYLDQAELTKMNAGIQPGMMPGSVPEAALDPDAEPPPPLGWAAYLTLHSQEKNIATDGSERVNINGEDLQLLYEDLVSVLGNEDWASFIVAYRIAGQSGGGGVSPLAALASMVAADAEQAGGGVLEAQLGALQAGGNNGGQEPPANVQPWNASLLDQFDLTQGGSVEFNQVLDLIDATVTLQAGGQGGQGGQQITYSSPFTSLPLDLANSTPILMNYLTTVDAATIPGRINIMECPQEILRGIPGLSDEVVDEILQARIDGSDSETRQFETWLAVEGYVTMDQMRALMPLITCGGDVFKAQIIGYSEAGSAFSRVEAIISGAGELPQIVFFRRLDHLGRGFDISVLGQRFDAVTPGGTSTAAIGPSF
ncbi:MAG: general secretion pathway protein GspK [Planctomycetota bacterium]|nr:MAG: general secretion pathway protein GspK [Planctomycetota bacterium]